MTRFASATETRIVVFARAPVPGVAKTRLIPLLGAAGAATLQEMLIERTLATARAAAIGPVELWCAPTACDPFWNSCTRRHSVDAVSQGDGDLGARMQHAAAAALAASSRVIIIGTDCPALTAAELRHAASALDEHHDAVLIPAEDGGYVLIGLKWWSTHLFSDIAWGSAQVLATTRARLAELGWRWQELPSSWDIDRPPDFARLCASGLIPGLTGMLVDQREASRAATLDTPAYTQTHKG